MFFLVFYVSVVALFFVAADGVSLSVLRKGVV